MFSPNLKRHFAAVARAIRGNDYEQTEGGILVMRNTIKVHGQYAYQTNKGGWSDWEDNLWPTEGMNFMLDLFGNHASIPAGVYIALYANALTPLATHTAATFPSTFAEITSGSEGFSESTRVAWVSAAASAAAIHNTASPAEFTIVTAGTLSVNGVAMLTASAKGATTGKLASASRFGATKTFSNTDIFDVKYQLTLS